MRNYFPSLLLFSLFISLLSVADSGAQPAVLPPPPQQLLVPGPADVLSPPNAPIQPTLADPADASQVPAEIAAPISAAESSLPAVIPAQNLDPIGQVIDPAPVVVAPAPHWYQLAYWFGPTPWDIGFELGLNGTEGLNEALSFRTGGHLKRETDFWKFDTTLVYNKNSANGVETQNNALLDVRVDRKLGESKWSLYFLNQELYDEFQAYDLRVSANTGVGYEIIDTEHLDLIGRFGLGASREFGGPDESTAFEALFGMEYDHEITKAQRLYAKLDYFPEWEDFSRYRVVADVGWEIDLDQPSNMSLKFSVIDRYDSTPNGADPNEINYSVLLIWGI